MTQVRRNIESRVNICKESSRYKNLIMVIAGLFIMHVNLNAAAQTELLQLNEAMVASTNNFLSSLSENQREAGIYNFDDEERLNWHFIPRPRNGIPLKELSSEQRAAAITMLQSFLSDEGFAKTEAVRGLESVLAEIEVNGRFVRDPELYYLTVFGTPSMSGSWGFRYEGHHLAFNWTFVAGSGIASSPQFMGTNPANVPGTVKNGTMEGLRVLGSEEDMARELLKSLSNQQLQSAWLDMDAPRDIFTAAEKEVLPLDDLGVSHSELTPNQQQQLMAIVAKIAAVQPQFIAQERMREIRADGLEKVRFFWIGGQELGDAHYFRVQGQSFLIEYDNTQNDANHVHLVWRDFDGDFGRDLIRLHYDSVASEHGDGHDH